MTDTIGVELPQALRVAVRDASGRPLAGAVVRFTPLTVASPDPAVTYPVLSTRVSPLAAENGGWFVAETTSTAGLASVIVRLGVAAGAAGVVITVPQAGLADTARYTVTPGRAAHVTVTPADSTVRVGGTLALTAVVRDRAGNPRPDPVTYAVAGTGLAVTPAGQVSAPAPAYAAVVASAAGATPDTAWVSAVPAGTLVVRQGNTLGLVETDGSGFRKIPVALPLGGASPEWRPDGQALLATLGNFGGPQDLYALTLSGVTSRAFPDQPSDGYYAVPGSVQSFTYSPDGVWLYLSGNSCNGNGILYRFRVGTAGPMERLSPMVDPNEADDCFDTFQSWPSLAPDGTRLVYENGLSFAAGYSLQLVDVATHAVTSLGIPGQRPRWSPRGDLIAYWSGNQIWVVAPDGTGARAVSPPGRRYAVGATWSPDGRYLLARYQPVAWDETSTVMLLDVTTGLEVPLSFTTGYAGTPAWRPGG